MTTKDQRISLQTKLEEILGSENVYFQPPSNIKMHYPCIVYTRSTGYSRFADNGSWIFRSRYQIQLISKDPDNPAFDELAKLPYSSYDRHYVVDNLNHDVFNIYW